jgi:hypothetical protein
MAEDEWDQGKGSRARVSPGGFGRLLPKALFRGPRIVAASRRQLTDPPCARPNSRWKIVIEKPLDYAAKQLLIQLNKR